MAYRVYITDALVCGHKNRNTSDVAYQLFTREAGMIWATAKSVRMEKSKHRYALQDFSHSKVSMVRGKGGWRIISSEGYTNLYYDVDSRYTRAMIRNIIRILCRVIRGEAAQYALYEDVIRGLSMRGHVHDVYLETVLAVRILHALGYVSDAVQYRHVLAENYQYNSVDTLTSTEIAACKEAVKNALITSQL